MRWFRRGSYSSSARLLLFGEIMSLNLLRRSLIASECFPSFLLPHLSNSVMKTMKLAPLRGSGADEQVGHTC